MSQENRRMVTLTEKIVIAVLTLEFLTYLFGIFGNPIKAGFELGQHVERLQTDFTYHVHTDSMFRVFSLDQLNVNAQDHAEFKKELWSRK
jgi:hypothetical protein